MNKKQITAVKKTVTMWEWLRDNPKKDKIAYLRIPRTLRKNAALPKWSKCYLCDIWNNASVECTEQSDCPLSTPKLMCNTAFNNPFEDWNDNIGVERSKQAQRIVNACKRWLRRYDK